MKFIFALAAVLLFGSLGEASTAYGTLNNFDVVNDTGEQCHGFEIELEDVHSTDVTYTYDWNHYGAPQMREDGVDPAHPKVSIRYESARGLNGEFLAYTAVPAGPLSPTNGHQCTNPGVNLGCEHFGVGFVRNPTAARYFWLVDDGSGNLVRGPAVNVATPTWTYVAPANGAPAQVRAVIQAPEPPEVHVKEFGEATWVKVIKTTTHNPGVVELKDLVSDDPDDPNDKNWQNGEPAEVEIEWSLLQEEFAHPGEGNGALEGADELAVGDETVTRRYEFFKYAGPYDVENNEAVCDKYPDPTPNKAECDTELLGDYIGAQMAGFDVDAVLGLIDHVENGDVDEPYTDRTVVVGGNAPYITTISLGALPDGLSIDSDTGVLSGTPTAAGTFGFTVTAEDADEVVVSKDYTVVIAGGPNDPLPSNLLISRLRAPSGGAAGAEVLIKLATSNAGLADARPSRTGMWFSSDKTLGGDVLIGTLDVPPVGPGSLEKGTLSATLPDVPPGIYYLIAQADLDEVVLETDEGDNLRVKKITIGPDLSATMSLSPAPPTSTNPTTVTVTVRNVGGALAAATVTRLYQSANAQLDPAGDVLLGEVATGELAPKGKSPAVFVVPLPAGAYYLIAQVDATNTVPEVREVNNVKKVKITVP